MVFSIPPVNPFIGARHFEMPMILDLAVLDISGPQMGTKIMDRLSEQVVQNPVPHYGLFRMADLICMARMAVNRYPFLLHTVRHTINAFGAACFSSAAQPFTFSI